MEIKEHWKLVKALVKPEELLLKEKTAKAVMLEHMLIGLGGELGELMDAVKKHTIYQQELDIENVIEELGDIEFYLEGFRQALIIFRDETVRHNINKLSKRYPNLQYTDQAAKERVDKVS